jgi:hypothetical protein
MRMRGAILAGVTAAAAMLTGAGAWAQAKAPAPEPAAPAQPAQPQAGWVNFTPAEHDFSALFPGQPLATAGAVASVAGATQRSYTLQVGPEAFVVAVFDYPKGRLPQPMAQADLGQWAEAFAGGAGVKPRTTTAISTAGRPGAELVFDDPETAAVLVLHVTQAGDRLYLIAFGGPKGSEVTPQAVRFVGSLRVR